MDRNLDELIRFLLEQIALRGDLGKPRSSTTARLFESLGSNPSLASVVIFEIIRLLLL